MVQRSVIAAAFLAVASSALAGHAVDFDTATGLAGGNSDQSVGWQFDVIKPVSVTHLSWYDDGQDGLSVDHKVGIWAPDGTLLTSVVIPKGTAATLDGIWRVVPVPSISLSAGTGYIVGGYNGANSTDRLAFNVAQTVAPQLAFFDATYSFINGIFERPTNFSAADNGFYGPSFNFVVPAPGALSALGLLGLAAGRRRRNA